MSDFSHSANEDEHFKRQELEFRAKLRAAKEKESKAEQAEKERHLHWMKCPKCGQNLETTVLRDVEIEICGACGVIVLDHGELDALGGGGSFVDTLIQYFDPKR